MLIPISYLVKKYNLKLENILHIGAHLCEELDDYVQYGARNIHWVEANKKLYRKCRSRLDKSINRISCAVISEKDDEKVSFKITNSLQSSSILKLKKHLEIYPEIQESKIQKRKTTTIDTLLQDSNLNKNDIDLINLDIQGAELLALKGAKNTLPKVRSIFTEVNEAELYENCALIHEIDYFLRAYGFRRVEKKMSGDSGWGDAFYIR